MDRLHLWHLVLISLWGGVIAVEVVFELVLREGERERRTAALLHYWVDLLVEGPLLAGILVTGALLLARAWPPTPLHVVKVACALVALAANGWCVTVVIRRRRALDDAAKLARLQRRVFLSGLATPFGLAAAYIGFAYFMP